MGGGEEGPTSVSAPRIEKPEPWAKSEPPEYTPTRKVGRCELRPVSLRTLINKKNERK